MSKWSFKKPREIVPILHSYFCTLANMQILNHSPQRRINIFESYSNHWTLCIFTIHQATYYLPQVFLNSNGHNMQWLHFPQLILPVWGEGDFFSDQFQLSLFIPGYSLSSREKASEHSEELNLLVWLYSASQNDYNNDSILAAWGEPFGSTAIPLLWLFHVCVKTKHYKKVRHKRASTPTYTKKINQRC